jgi:hypothetical protein
MISKIKYFAFKAEKAEKIQQELDAWAYQLSEKVVSFRIVHTAVSWEPQVSVHSSPKQSVFVTYEYEEKK